MYHLSRWKSWIDTFSQIHDFKTLSFPLFPFDPPSPLPPKTSDNQRFSNAFRAIKKEQYEEKG